jgi:peptidyl-prolyl cis-trans isomerase D
MLGSFRKGRANVLIWALMAMLVVGLGGWGIGIGGGITVRDVARVGDRPVTTEDYVRALQQELRAYSQQLGRDLPMAEAREYGIDRLVLARLVNDAALDEEAARLGLSAGDEAVRAQVMATPAFQGADGKFSRDAYTYALERIGMRPAEFEELLRAEAARELVAGGVQAPARMPETAGRTVLDFLGEKRGFEWLRLDAAQLPAPIAAPTDAELQAEYEAHPDRYTSPETRRITTASITPDALAATIEIPEDELRAAYEADSARYRTPERRVADRIGFATAEEAAAARARLDAGEIDFDALAAERGLTPEDIDQGFVVADELTDAARDAVFGAEGPGIVGPVDTPLGPSLYRINAILAAATTPFEEAQAELARDRARAEAERLIHEDTARIEDLLAGGATAEEIAAETVLEPGTLALDAGTTGGLADDPAFRAAAEAAEVGVETDAIALEGGGLATLRVDAVEPPALLPLAEVRDRVAADWTAARTAEALTGLAEGYAAELDGGLTLAALGERIGRPVTSVAPLTRADTAEGAPPALVAEVFAAEPDATVVLADGATVILARLGAIEPFDPAAADNASAMAAITEQLDRQAADDILTLFTAAVRDEAGVSVNQALVESTLARFP